MIGAGIRRLLFAACLLPAGVSAGATDPDFGMPSRVTLHGYDGDAMEPFVTRDGRYLLFNNRNDPRIDTNLQIARRLDDLTFEWTGEVAGANSTALDAVPSVDDRGNLYFVSVRGYADTLSTIYRAKLDGATASRPELVDGISRRLRGFLNFDAEISADGRTLFFVDGRLDGGPHPRTADIAIAVRDGPRFRRLADGKRLLGAVNTSALEYAPCVSTDLLELLFTRLDRSRRLPKPEILRALRRNLNEPFGAPERVAAIDGFVEAPALSADGRNLYFHRLEGGRFVIYMSRR
jgi:hypothetical protein